MPSINIHGAPGSATGIRTARSYGGPGSAKSDGPRGIIRVDQAAADEAFTRKMNEVRIGEDSALVGSISRLKEMIALREREANAMMRWTYAEAQAENQRRTQRQNQERSLVVQNANFMNKLFDQWHKTVGDAYKEDFVREQKKNLAEQRAKQKHIDTLNRLMDGADREDIARAQRKARADQKEKERAATAWNRTRDQADRDNMAFDQRKALADRREREKEANAWNKTRERADRDNMAFDQRRMRQQQAAEERRRIRSDPATYAAQAIRGIGASGYSAALSGNTRGARREYTRLDRLEQGLLRSQAQANPAQARAIADQLEAVQEARAKVSGGYSTYKSGLGSFGRAWSAVRNLEFDAFLGGGLSALVPGIGEGTAAILEPGITALATAAELFKRGAEVPFQINSMYQNIIGSAKPYLDLMYGSANIGRGGGFEGSALMNRLYPGDRSIPDYALRFGLDPNQARQIISATGIPVTSADDAMAVLNSVGRASRSAYVGDLGIDRLAQAAGFANTMGLARDRTVESSQFGGAGRTMTLDQYFSEMQRTMTAATMLGLDHSKVLGTVEGLLRQSANAGSANATFQGMSDYWYRLAGSGAAGFRSGEATLAAAQGAMGAISRTGYGGDATHIMVAKNWIDSHGGLPKDIQGLKRVFSPGIIDSLQATPYGRSQIADLLDAGRSGDMLSFSSVAQDIWNGNPDLWTQMSISYANSQVGGGVRGRIAAGAVSGEGIAGIRGWETGATGGRPAAVGQGWAGISDPNVITAISAAQRSAAPDVDPNMLAGLFERESRFDPTIINSTGHVGLGQISRENAEYYHLTTQQLQNPNINAYYAAKILEDNIQHYKARGMAPQAALKMGFLAYHWGPRAIDNFLDRGVLPQGVTSAGQLDDEWNNLLSRSLAFQNNTEVANRALATGGQLSLAAGQAGYSILEAATGPLEGGTALTIAETAAQGLGITLTTATSTVDAFTAALRRGADWILEHIRDAPHNSPFRGGASRPATAP